MYNAYHYVRLLSSNFGTLESASHGDSEVIRYDTKDKEHDSSNYNILCTYSSYD